MSCNWVASVFIHHPNIILTGIALISGTCLVIPFAFFKLPKFSDPQMGFESRGTTLAERATAWKNLVEATKHSGQFTVNPKEYLYEKNFTSFVRAKKKKLKNQGIVHQTVYGKNRSSFANNNIEDNWSTLEKFVSTNNRNVIVPNSNTEKFFCGDPDENYAQLIFKSKGNDDLFTLDSLFNMCRLQEELTSAKYFKSLCIVTPRKPKECCKPWSLSNYIALLNDRASCLAIVEKDVTKTKALLRSCAKYYHNSELEPECSTSRNCKVPKDCYLYDAVYNILNYLTDTSFLPSNDLEQTKLEETVIFLPMACSSATLPYYEELGDIQLNYRGITAVAMEFGLKTELFNEKLLRDTWLMILGAIFVIVCMWLYTKSLFLTIMTIMAIVFSLGVSYFLYTLIFKLRFFPFMNLLAAVIAIGVGADDAFIFCKVWNTIKQENGNSLVTVMSHTLYHALISMFVTSLTTAVAFLASYLSSITALRCFGVFAGVAVIANYLLMISWLPASVVVYEKYCILRCGVLKSCLLVCLERWCCSPQWKLIFSRIKMSYSWWDKIMQNHENYILDVLIKFKVAFFIVLTLIAVVSSIIVFYYPRLELPNTNELQLFKDEHPFEQYDLVHKHKFWFKNLRKDINGNTLNYKLPLRFVWGVKPVDNGDYMDPQGLGTLELDQNFNISHPDSQVWLLNFCKDVRRQPFYQSTFGPMLSNCFIESFVSWMERRCIDTINDNVNRAPCCETSKFPYNPRTFDTCILDAISDLYETPSTYFMPGMAGAKFSKEMMPVIKAVVIEYDSNYSYSMSYEYVKDFYEKVEKWMMQKLETAPPTMKGGWFISDLEFYDLQRVLSINTLIAVIISMTLALFVLFFTTLNVLNSIYAIFSITCSIMTTMAILVLSGWKLNILESIAISSTTGLTIDFSLHFSVNYRLCPTSITENRENATRYAISTMLNPITMAALTTAAAGAFMMPSSILAYKQLGQFLLTIMFVSWIYSIFHLGSLLAIAGPERQFGQYYYSRIFCTKSERNRPQENRPVPSTSSDTHELESLTSKSDVQVYKTSQRSSSIPKSDSNIRFGFSDQSPTAMSAITIIMADDN